MQTFAVNVECVACAFVEHIYVEPMHYIQWVSGIHVQDAFPYLTADERDCLVSNMCLDCLDEMYRDAREEDEDAEWAEREVWVEDPDNDPLNFPVEYESDYYVDRDCD